MKYKSFFYLSLLAFVFVGLLFSGESLGAYHESNVISDSVPTTTVLSKTDKKPVHKISKYYLWADEKKTVNVAKLVKDITEGKRLVCGKPVYVPTEERTIKSVSQKRSGDRCEIQFVASDKKGIGSIYISGYLSNGHTIDVRLDVHTKDSSNLDLFRTLGWTMVIAGPAFIMASIFHRDDDGWDILGNIIWSVIYVMISYFILKTFLY